MCVFGENAGGFSPLHCLGGELSRNIALRAVLLGAVSTLALTTGAMATDFPVSVTGAQTTNALPAANAPDSNSIFGTGGGASANSLTLLSAQTYTALTNVGNGSAANGVTFTASGNNFFSAASLTTVNIGGVLDVAGTTQSITSLSLRGGAIAGGATGALTAGIISVGGDIGAKLTGASSLTAQGGVVGISGTTTLGSFANDYTGQTTVNNAGTLTLTGSGKFSAASLTIVQGTGVLDLAGTSQTINNVNLQGATIQNGSLTAAVLSTGGTISAKLTGASAFTAADGTTVLSNSGNDYTGLTSISNADPAKQTILTVSGSGKFSAASNTVVGANGVLDLAGTSQSITTVSLQGGTVQSGALTAGVVSTGGNIGSQLTGASGISAVGGTTTLSSASNDYTGVTAISNADPTKQTILTVAGAGKFSAASNTVVGANGVLDLAGTSQSIANVALQGGKIQSGILTANVVSTGGNIGSQLTGTSGISAAGGTTTLSSASNDYTGVTAISNADPTKQTILTVAGAGKFSAASNTVVGANGVLDLAGTPQSIANVSLQGGKIQSGMLTANVVSTGGNIGSQLTGASGISAVGGTTFLSSASNDYTGDTFVGKTGGTATLTVAGAGALSAASRLTVGSGGVLNLSGTTQSVNAVALQGGTLTGGVLATSLVSAGGTVDLTLAGANGLTTSSGVTTVDTVQTYTGVTSVQAGTTLLLTGGGQISQSQTLANAGSFILSGAGTAATFTNSVNPAAGDVTNTGTISGNGVFTATTVANQGAIAMSGGSFNLASATAAPASLHNFAGMSIANTGGAGVSANSGVNVSVVNDANAPISGSTSGVTLTGTGSSVVSVTNSGSISGGTAAGVQLSAAAGGATNLTNTGTISSTSGSGVAVGGAGAGALNNTGTITGGLSLNSLGMVVFNNNAGGAINGGPTSVSGMGALNNAVAANVSGGVTVSGNGVVNNNGGSLSGGVGINGSGVVNNNVSGANAGLIYGMVNVQGGGRLNNAGTVANGVWIDGNGSVVNGLGGNINSGATVNGSGSLVNNGGTISGGVTVVGATYTQTSGVTSGVIANNGGKVNIAGTSNGIVNAGTLALTGNLTANGDVSNGAGSTFTIGGNALSGVGQFANAGTASIAQGGSLTAASFTNSATGGFTLTNGTITAPTFNNAGTMAASGVITTPTLTNSGIFSLNGNLAVSGDVVNTNSFTVAGSTLSAKTVTNSGAFTTTGTIVAGSVTNAANSTMNAEGAINTATFANNGALTLTNSLSDNVSGAQFNNAGTFIAKAPASQTLSLGTNGNGTFNNSGRLDLTNGSTGSAFTLNGNYFGQAGSTIGVNVVGTGGGQINTLAVTGSATGTTQLSVKVADPLNPVFLSSPVKFMTSGNTPSSTFFASDVLLNFQNVAPSNSLVSYQVLAKSDGYYLTDSVNGQAVGAVVGGLASAVGSAQAGFFQGQTAFIGSPPNQQANFTNFGVWTRDAAGVNIEKSAVSSSGGSDPTPLSTVSHFSGEQVGADMAVFNAGGSGWNFHAGLTGGEYDTSSESFGSSHVGFRVPFLGVYAAVTGHGFNANILIRHDFWYGNVSDDGLALTNARMNGSGNAVTAEAGYQFSFQNGVFLKPTVGFSYNRASFDSLSGGSNTQTPGMPFIPQYQLSMGPVVSELGVLSLQTGYRASAGDWALIPNLGLSVWREFAGAIPGQASSQNTSTGTPFNFALATSRVGTFGQVGVGVAASPLKLPNLLMFLRADYRAGENLTGGTFTFGARYSF